MSDLRNIKWTGDAATGALRLLDQTRLPGEITFIDCRDVPAVWDAIKRLVVRGAPAIGVAAAYGCVVAVQPDGDRAAHLKRAAEYLATSRPTAVNLFWALQRMQRVQPCTPEAMLAEAKRIHEEDAAMCRAIGEHGLRWLLERATGRTKPNRTQDLGLRTQDSGLRLLTHCNAGALATGGIGTATAPMYLAHQQGLPIAVYADETRPLLQGARLTAFELAAAGVDVTLICDGMAAQVMREGRVDCVITGADRIASNGDAANKIGTYNLAVLAKHHGIPFVVAAPSSTFDMSLADGSAIPIELRASDEITHGFGKRTAPDLPNLKTYNPAFDVTPHELIAAIITEKGVIEPVNSENVRRVLG
ncbi:MAG: S-methyl-5-thioribose-1-phosphate isomerase [Phycisphaeraceae bacterium]